MKFSLIHYDVARIANEPGNKTVMKHFGHMPNIQLLYVASILESLNIEVQYIDIVGMEFTDAEVDQKLKDFKPDFIAMSVFTSHYHNAKSYAEHYKSILPETKILLGGVHVSIFPVDTLEQCSFVDFACDGEAEMFLPEFIKCIKGNEPFEGVPGLIWRNGNEIKYNGPAPVNLNPDATPFPARHLVPNEKYFNFISTKRNYTIFNTSRGCPFQCIFCEASGKKWRARSPENIVAEYEECYEKYGIREIDIFDSSFTVNKKRVLKMCELLVKNGLNKKIIWNVRSRVDTIDEELLDALKEGGCYRIFYGIESANPEVLRKMKKGIDRERVRYIIKRTKQVKISSFGYFLVGAPGDTHETIRETIDFAKSLPFDFAIFNCLTAFPMTELYDKYYRPFVENDFWNDYIKADRPPETFMGRPWIDIPDEELRKTAHKAMLEFYFRPIQLYRAFQSIGSLEQFCRYSSAAVDMFLSYFRK